MEKFTPSYPDTARNRLLASVASLVFGRNPDQHGEPDIGWRATLARHLGMNKNAVSDTMRQPGSPKFDRGLADFVSDKRIEMVRNAVLLEHEEAELRGPGNPVMTLWIVEVETDTEHSIRLAWGVDAGEIAAYYLHDLLPDQMVDQMRIDYDETRATARAGSRRVHVRYTRDPVVLLNGELNEARELLDRVGTKRQPQMLSQS